MYIYIYLIYFFTLKQYIASILSRFWCQFIFKRPPSASMIFLPLWPIGVDEWSPNQFGVEWKHCVRLPVCQQRIKIALQIKCSSFRKWSKEDYPMKYWKMISHLLGGWSLKWITRLFTTILNHKPVTNLLHVSCNQNLRFSRFGRLKLAWWVNRTTKSIEIWSAVRCAQWSILKSNFQVMKNHKYVFCAFLSIATFPNLVLILG